MRHERIDVSGSVAADAPNPPRPRLRRVAAAIFFAAFLSIQIVVPFVQLVWSTRPARFGWQMYSVVSVVPQFELIMRDGAVNPLDITPYVTSRRGDVPLTRFLPAHLCALFPNAAAIHYQMEDGSQAGTHPCGS
jgi:hypothetical protein